MADIHESPDDPLPAGDFSAWLREMTAALRGDGESVVPCAGCTACCRASQFVHIAPDETGTLAHIPYELLFPAPRMPRGHVVLGYDERGHCPMLVDDRCSIYERRPRACRTYDCRIFAATGIDPAEDGEEKREVGRRARRWRFGFPTAEDRAEYAAVRAAARHLEEHPDGLAAQEAPTNATPTNPTRRAVCAIEIHGSFLAAPPPHDRDRSKP